jgi:hypothetical protein
MTIVTSNTTPAGSYPVTVTGTGPGSPGLTHSTTYTLNVTVASTGAITNGGFETGSLAGWTIKGTEGATTSGPRSGRYADLGGAVSPTNGDSSITQLFTAPAGATKLTFYYKMTCPDSVRYDWATATLRDNTTGATKTVLPRTCASNSSWVAVTTTIVAGRSYTLTLTSHDDNYPNDGSYTRFDDVFVS